MKPNCKGCAYLEEWASWLVSLGMMAFGLQSHIYTKTLRNRDHNARVQWEYENIEYIGLTAGHRL